MTTKKPTNPVVVTTEHRGVFFGYLNDENLESPTLSLTNARMCVYWSSDIHGVLGLASSGPSSSCKVTPEVPKIILQKVTSVMTATPEAVLKWKATPWG